ncbi:MAG: hypothetical protein AUH85_04930 [Chloroflexi bacterium 13_1_40CM_4_68_4]|nr:MAG: hypothetical protein AUH85_04930 [Chloroflexi bacterium 13_1_40CM_4_68_4]
MLLRAITGGGLVLIGMGLVANVQQLLVLRFLQGVLSGTGAAAATLVATITPREETGYAVGLVSGGTQIGNFIGPVLGGIALLGLGFRWSFGVSGAVLLCCAVAAALWVSDVPSSRTAPDRASRSLRTSLAPLLAAFGAFAWPELRGVVFAQFLTQATFAATVALFPLYVQAIARPSWLSIELAIGAALAATALASAVATPVFGRLADRRGATNVLAFGAILGGSALVLHAAEPDAIVVVLLRLLIGIAAAAITAATVVLTRRAAHEGTEGRAFGASLGAQMLGWGSGPLLGAAIVASSGLPALFVVAGLATASIALGALLVRAWFPLK